MKTIASLLCVFSVLVMTGCGSSGSPLTKNINGNALYQENGDSVESGTAVFDNGTDSYRVEILDYRFGASIPAGTYKVWFENVKPVPVQAKYASREKTPLEVTVLGGRQNMSLQVYGERKAKKR